MEHMTNLTLKILTWTPVVKSNSFTMTEAWILSKLQSLVKTVTLSLDSCRLNEGAKNWKIS